MSVRVDSSPLIPGALIIGDTGLGVLAQDVPVDGFLYPSLVFPDDTDVEVRGFITAGPTGPGNILQFFAYEDSSFDLDVDVDGQYTFDFDVYKDGVLYESNTAVIQIGMVAPVASVVFTGLNVAAFPDSASVFFGPTSVVFPPHRSASSPKTDFPEDIERVITAPEHQSIIVAPEPLWRPN